MVEISVLIGHHVSELIHQQTNLKMMKEKKHL